eukprot:3940840-Rhodomonas_salina.5
MNGGLERLEHPKALFRRRVGLGTCTHTMSTSVAKCLKRYPRRYPRDLSGPRVPRLAKTCPHDCSNEGFLNGHSRPTRDADPTRLHNAAALWLALLWPVPSFQPRQSHKTIQNSPPHKDTAACLCSCCGELNLVVGETWR